VPYFLPKLRTSFCNANGDWQQYFSDVKRRECLQFKQEPLKSITTSEEKKVIVSGNSAVSLSYSSEILWRKVERIIKRNLMHSSCSYGVHKREWNPPVLEIRTAFRSLTMAERVLCYWAPFLLQDDIFCWKDLRPGKLPWILLPEAIRLSFSGWSIQCNAVQFNIVVLMPNLCRW